MQFSVKLTESVIISEHIPSIQGHLERYMKTSSLEGAKLGRQHDVPVNHRVYQPDVRTRARIRLERKDRNVIPSQCSYCVEVIDTFLLAIMHLWEKTGESDICQSRAGYTAPDVDYLRGQGLQLAKHAHCNEILPGISLADAKVT